MPWKGVTVSEQRQRFLEDYQLNYYSVSELAERFSISRKTAHMWINRFKKHGQAGFHEQSRRPLGRIRLRPQCINWKWQAFESSRESGGASRSVMNGPISSRTVHCGR
jgi:transposase-like protein